MAVRGHAKERMSQGKRVKRLVKEMKEELSVAEKEDGEEVKSGEV